MNRDTFLARLRHKLGNIRPDVLDDIIFDFEEHFLVARETGASEEEICAILGDPDEIAKTYLEELSSELTHKPEGEKREQKQNEHSDEYDEDGIRIISKKAKGSKNPYTINIPTIQLHDFDSIIDEAFPEGLKDGIIKIGEMGIEFGNLGETLRKSLNSEVFDKIQRKLDRNISRYMRYSRDSDNDNDDWDDDGFDEGKTGEAPSESSIEHDGVDTVEIEFRNADITIEPSEDDKIHYRFEALNGYNAAAEIYLDASENGGKKLILRDVQGAGRRACCKKCYVKLPQSFSGEVDVKSTSGDIGIADMKTSAVYSLRTVSGNVFINSCEADITPKSVSGNIKINGLVLTRASKNIPGERLMVKTASGNISAAGLKSGVSVDLTSGSGNLIVNDSWVNLGLRTGSGNIIIEGLIGDAYANTGSGTIKISDHKGGLGGSSGSGTIDVSTFKIATPVKFSTGSGNIRFSAKEISAPAEVSSSVGSIHLKIEKLSQPFVARTNMGDIKASFGGEMNLKFDVDAEQVKTKRERAEHNPQYPDVLVTLIAKRGKVVLEDLD